ncbi:MAG: phenylalanine--tRNA ligase subunit alpha [Gammaproteobacteria bacterium]|nr:phenylalanine--tRNA ligase subunit alpha [Gammaproteobacteria bacterium]
MLENIQALLAQATEEIKHASDLNQLNTYRVHYLGKKSPVTELAKEISRVPVEDRPRVGQSLNEFKRAIQSLLTARLDLLQSLDIEKTLAKDRIDVTLPGRGHAQGHLHPIAITRQRIESFFKGLGFAVVEGPEIEDDYHNFSALNIPENHPARAMQDTFYVDDHLLLRTHMSPVQIRTMKNNPPPLRIIAPGRVYRRDFDVTHTPMFHQVEGLYVDHDVSFAHLKYVMQSFLNAFFERDIPVRFRSSYFPFTEPSAELDVQCTSCYGKGCRICSHTGWLEVVGCGMVHPNVLKEVGIDTEVYQGFAFGFGYDRLTMLYYGVNDLRAFFENDMRFLQQF